MVQMPKGAQVLTARFQQGMPFLWAVVEEDQPFEPRIFRVVCAGEVFNAEGLIYITSFEAEDWFIGHVFEQPASGAPDPISDRYKDDFKDIRPSNYEPKRGERWI